MTFPSMGFDQTHDIDNKSLLINPYSMPIEYRPILNVNQKSGGYSICIVLVLHKSLFLQKITADFSSLESYMATYVTLKLNNEEGIIMLSPSKLPMNFTKTGV